MEIRRGTLNDIDTIMAVYTTARNYMRANGNPNQWIDGYPHKETILDDIEKGNCYVVIENGEICGVFAFIHGDDPTYEIIEKGAWKNNKPYSTIHRIASNGKHKGILKTAVEYCIAQAADLRIDTHHDNLTMQHLVTKHGFEKCGIIYLENGDPRIAYQYTRK